MPLSQVDRKKLALELESRRELFALVSENPGIHFRDIQRRKSMATGKITYNLEQLVKVGLLTAVRDGEFLRYYAAMSIDPAERVVLEYTRRKSVRHILLCLAHNEVCNNEELSLNLNLSPSTVSWHVKRLVDANIVNANPVGRKVFYSAKDVELVKRVLIRYRESFMDKIVDRFVDMWET
jgi:predicted transcriptional regulator